MPLFDPEARLHLFKEVKRDGLKQGNGGPDVLLTLVSFGPHLSYDSKNTLIKQYFEDFCLNPSVLVYHDPVEYGT